MVTHATYLCIPTATYNSHSISHFADDSQTCVGIDDEQCTEWANEGGWDDIDDTFDEAQVPSVEVPPSATAQGAPCTNDGPLSTPVAAGTKLPHGLSLSIHGSNGASDPWRPLDPHHSCGHPARPFRLGKTYKSPVHSAAPHSDGLDDLSERCPVPAWLRAAISESDKENAVSVRKATAHRLCPATHVGNDSAIASLLHAPFWVYSHIAL